jgi:hypothetical protein
MSFEDFDPTLPDDEREELDRLAQRLVAQRPLPAPAFRGELRRRIVAQRPPRRLRLRVGAYLASGTALLAVATLGVLNVGPLAPQPLSQPAAQAQVIAR